MKLFVAGREGQVARALARLAPAQGFTVTALGRPQLDLTRPETIAPIITEAAPDIIINAAAYTAVDRAEAERDEAFALNAAGAEALAHAAAAVGAPIVHVSTDYVFAGDKATPYAEDDVTGPRTVYGASKLAGEQRVADANPRAVIVRTAWVFDAQGQNFVRTMLNLARTRPVIDVVADQIGCPTYADDLAKALLAIAERGAVHPGIYHCAGAGEATWAQFAEAIFALSAARGGPSARVRPIPASAYPKPAPRPANSRLDCSKLARDYDVRLRSWQEALADCLDAIAAAGWRVE